MALVLRWRSGRRTGRASDGGSVTAEMAVALPAVVVVLALVLAVGAVAGAQLRCQDAARAGAREAALGASPQRVAQVARAVAGEGADVGVVHDPPWVRVSVAAPSAGGLLSGIVVSATAHAHQEP